MEDSPQVPKVAGAQEPLRLPQIDSPPAEEVLDGVPSTEQVVKDAQTADDIVDGQPSVDELLGREA